MQKTFFLVFIFLLIAVDEGLSFNSVSVTINYSESNYELFEQVALAKDRILFFRAQVLNKKGALWPKKAIGLKKGQVVTTWPSWKLAQELESVWAEETDVFGYDIEYDSPVDETNNVTRTIKELSRYLEDISGKYNHKIKLSAGVNYAFGSRHIAELSRAEEIHIHANQLLRRYPAKDKRGQDYVEWAVNLAEKARTVNPKVEVLFAVLMSGMDVEQAIKVAESLSLKMKERKMEFSGFTMWAETQDIAEFLRALRGDNHMR